MVRLTPLFTPIPSEYPYLTSTDTQGAEHPSQRPQHRTTSSVPPAVAEGGTRPPLGARAPSRGQLVAAPRAGHPGVEGVGGGERRRPPALQQARELARAGRHVRGHQADGALCGGRAGRDGVGSGWTVSSPPSRHPFLDRKPSLSHDNDV